MKDFQLRTDTRLLFRNDPLADLAQLVQGKKVLFVYGGGSVKKNGCYDDVQKAIFAGQGELIELAGASREMKDIQRGIALAKKSKAELIIGAGGAQIMDCAKLIAFGLFHEADLWDYLKGRKNPYGQEKLPLILLPTYPSSGSEYGLGAVAADTTSSDFGTAYGIAADVALLVPKYALSLNAQMTAYTGLVTLVQLSAAALGDKNKVSYDMAVSVMRNVLTATQILRQHPDDLDARGTILYGAALSTSGNFGIGKEDNYAYDIYEVEFIPEMLFGVPYRESLTTLFPRFLQTMAAYHEADVRQYLHDVYGFTGNVADTVQQVVDLYENLGVPMYFSGTLSAQACAAVQTHSRLSAEEIFSLLQACTEH